MQGRFAVGLALLIMLLVWPAHAQNNLDANQLDRIARTVVLIEALRDGFPISTGSGTIVRSSGLIYTNRHVVEGADDFAIYLLEDLNERPILRYFARVNALYPARIDNTNLDFAALQIDRDVDGTALGDTQLLGLPALNTEAFGTVRRGDDIFVFGYPGIGDGYLVFTDGIITTIQNGTIDSARIPTLFQTSAEIAPGNSGGLAVDSNGTPIGMPTAVNTETQTGGRLGGIQPFSYLQAVINSDVDIEMPAAGAVIDSTITSNSGFEGVPSSIGAVVDCPGNSDISNGVEIVIFAIRPGFEYIATAIGLDDFDPVLAAAPTQETFIYNDPQVCSDDADGAEGYSVDLPSTGNIAANRFSSQVTFSQNTGDLLDFSLIVGEYDGNAGEFVLIVEGMAATGLDGLGDPFILLPTPNLFTSSTLMRIYQIGIDQRLNPFMYAYTDGPDGFLADRDGDLIACDDAATRDCYGQSRSLAGSSVTLRSRVVNADSRDVMLSVAPNDLQDNRLPLPLIMTSSRQASTGQYLLVFHLGIN